MLIKEILENNQEKLDKIKKDPKFTTYVFHLYNRMKPSISFQEFLNNEAIKKLT